MNGGAVATLGFHGVRIVARLGQIGAFGAQLVAATFAPPFRYRRVLDEVWSVGVLSLAIVCVSGGAVGMVLALQGYNTLSRFGAEESLGTVVGLTLIRELGPVLTSLLVTGRAGSAIAAEIGAMVATQQLDGLRMLSVDPVHFVAAPKAVAMAISMPLLSALFITSGLWGGFLVGVAFLGIDGGSYLSGLESSGCTLTRPADRARPDRRAGVQGSPARPPAHVTVSTTRAISARPRDCGQRA